MHHKKWLPGLLLCLLGLCRLPMAALKEAKMTSSQRLEEQIDPEEVKRIPSQVLEEQIDPPAAETDLLQRLPAMMRKKRRIDSWIWWSVPVLILCFLTFVVSPYYANLHLMEAIKEGDTDKIRWLLVLGADINLETEGDTTLTIATSYGQAEAAEFLLARGARVNRANAVGTSPLMFASLHGDKELMQLLIRYKADVNARDDGGVTAWQYALWTRHAEVVPLLQQAGAKK